MTYQSVDPNTGKTLKSFEHLSSTQLEKSLATAESCFQTWKHTSYTDRAQRALRPAPRRTEPCLARCKLPSSKHSASP